MLMIIPDNERTELTATNEVRNVADWITLDAMRAADFTYGDEPVYCTFSWEDRSGAIIYSYEVVYRWDSGKLIRDETVERWENEEWLLDSQYGIALARNIESYSDVTFNSSVGEYSYLEVHINSNVADQSKVLEIYVNSRITHTEDELTPTPTPTPTPGPTPTPTPHDVIAFSDSFESGLSQWDDNGTTQWTIQSDYVHDGYHSAECDNYDNSYLTSDDIDLSDATAADLDFWFNKRYLNNDEFELYFYDGSSYNFIASLDAQGSDSTWLNWDNVPIDLGIYGISNFRIRFYGYSNSDMDYATVDELVLTKTVP